MNLSNKSFDQVLTRLVGDGTRPSDGDMDSDITRVRERIGPATRVPFIENMEADGARVVRRLKSERRNAPSENSSASLVKVSRAWWQPVAAAVLIATVGIGLYAAAQRSDFMAAIFGERVSPPEAVPPTQVAALPQGTDAGAARLQLPRLRFAAASVRPLPSPLDQAGNRVPGVPTRQITLIKCLGVDGQLWVPFYAQDPTPPRRGRCTGQGVRVDMLVVTAYASSPLVSLSGFRLVGYDNPMPAVVQIEAVAGDPERVTKGELQQMLQTLLADRFKARVHFETRELDGFVLTIAKSGIKFKEIPGEATPAACGRPNPYSASGPCTMQMVVKRLGDAVRVPIDDKTGLTGTYDIDFFLEDPLSAANAPGVRGGGGQNPGPLQFSPPVPKAVEDQLGLHLEPGKVQVEFIVVDHLELPTEN